MAVGFIILAHEHLDRVAQVAGYWAQRRSPVVIHVDARADDEDYRELQDGLARFDNIRFVERRACEWGRFSIVSATLDAATLLLSNSDDISHVFLASGSCLPLRPLEEMNAYLDKHAGTDFIESVTTQEVTWTVGGLDLERFTLRFPFSWKRRRRIFDGYVKLQRRLGISRAIPEGVRPHLGSQWWCLTRETLEAILTDPDREVYDSYFSTVWIPDEAYFQTLVRKHSTMIESRSLTLSRFDFQGKPHVFYEDHLQLLQRSDCFVARKIWPRANLLYREFLGGDLKKLARIEPNPRKLDKIFAKAIDKRLNGRDGLQMQSRFPKAHLWNLPRTCASYSVFEGFSDLFSNFETWLEKRTGTRVHGHLFNKRTVKFAGNATIYNGCLANSAKLRDYNPEKFLASLIWNTQGEHQSFQFGPADRQDISGFASGDPNASFFVITGAWAVPLFHSKLNFQRVRRVAARYQSIEARHVNWLRQHEVRAHVNIWSLAEFVETPMPILQTILDGVDPTASRKLTEVPKMADLTGFGQFVQKLKNEGMNPHSVGDFPLGRQSDQPVSPAKPYAVR
ncbi:MAG: beta-1,6-N-acetylglucosaminyltransferase [Alphaproteobacteria bacterium]|nr:beta-1,6-N-acetylglucosaminyltransferase [Alphaproteobacteria bacterium]